MKQLNGGAHRLSRDVNFLLGKVSGLAQASVTYLLLVLVFGCDYTAPLPSKATSQLNEDVVTITDVHEDDGTIIGELKNLSSYSGRFKIEFAYYDSSGAKVGSTSDSIRSLERGERWKFKVHIFDRDAKSYQFVGVESRYGTVKASYETREESKRAREAAILKQNQHEQLEIEDSKKKETEVRAKAASDAMRLQQLALQAQQKSATMRLIQFQRQQASNGLPAFQYDLGMRYLTGDGVETNQLLAIYWLKSACTNGSSAASNALAKQHF